MKAIYASGGVESRHASKSQSGRPSGQRGLESVVMAESETMPNNMLAGDAVRLLGRASASEGPDGHQKVSAHNTDCRFQSRGSVRPACTNLCWDQPTEPPGKHCATHATPLSVGSRSTFMDWSAGITMHVSLLKNTGRFT